MRSSLTAALALVLLATTPVAGAPLDDLLAGLNLIALHGAAPAALALERLADGKTVALPQLRGRPVIVYFWATWGPYCARELPSAIEQVHREYGPRGLVGLAVNMEESRETVSAPVHAHKLTMDPLLDVTA